MEFPTASFSRSALKKISVCEACGQQAREVTIWIDRKIDMPRGNEDEYSETLSLCEPHAFKVLDALFEYPYLTCEADRDRLLRVLQLAFAHARR
jgi:hypothetical protein